MNGIFYSKIQGGLSSERLEAYAVRSSGANPEPVVTLARYLLNMALCESLYSPLQLCEIALRNAIHHHLSSLMSREECSLQSSNTIKTKLPARLSAQREGWRGLGYGG